MCLHVVGKPACMICIGIALLQVYNWGCLAFVLVQNNDQICITIHNGHLSHCCRDLFPRSCDE